jgi:branched-chain amino acid transport system permease protein
MKNTSSITGTSGSRSPWLALALAVLAIVVALLAPMMLYPVFLMKLMCFGLLAAAFNLLIGYTGLMSFGHAAFFGTASYVTAHAAKVWQLSPELSILAGTAAAAILGLAFGVLAVKRHGIFFAMVTLALSQMVYFLALQLPFTGGEDGIQSVPRGFLFGIFNLADSATMYVFVLAVTAAALFAMWRIVNSPYGEALAAIRDNERRAMSLGYNVERYKLLAFVLSATFAGLGGAMKALVFQLASLTDITWQMSGEVVLMVLVGGMGTFLGPIIGSAFVVTLEQYLASSGLPVQVVVGVFFVVCVMLFRRGVVGAFYKAGSGK